MNQPAPFPLRFEPSFWNGPRARQYSDRSDAFQQLVGDALRELFGSRASVSPTEGRDGAIDAFIGEDQSGRQHAFADLPAPQIIECKDHDDTRDGYLMNIAIGWRKVAEKLRRQALSGWTGHFRPWHRARSYVYCMSAVLPNQEERDKLLRSITEFFDGLPADQRPPLEKIRVLDWADLRDLLDRLPRVADRWIGTGLTLVLGHAEYCARLTRFRRYLLEGYLPFVEPAIETKIHPQAILARLEALAGVGGVMLKGVGGVGKTRMALEVAHLADASNWRVLHVLPGEPGVTIEDLSAVLFTGSTRTLLVFDYLDQMPKLDLGSLRHQLLPEANRRGESLALLANLRPSSLRRPQAERDALFIEDILVQPTAEQKSSITELALDRIAPLAVAQFGRQRVRELCGERPIIAMFVAEELQRQAQQGILAPASLISLRSGDLLSWLRRRLIEDKLVLDGGSGFLPPEPEPSLIAAAAMLAAAPLGRNEMQEAGRDACQAAGGDGDLIAGRVLDGLLSLGWLEPRALELAAAHDVVADEVLAQVLWDRPVGKLRDSVMPWILAPALSSARVLGRYATALSRLLGSEAVETEKEAALREQASVWLRSQSSRLGEMLALAEVSEAAYAMGAMVSAPAWAAACVVEWSQLVTPWLTEHGTHAEARHLLYRGLKELPVESASELIVAALNWIPEHISGETANFVLRSLVCRADLGEHAPRAIDLAMAWLEEFPLSPEAQFLLHALLPRTGLGEHAPRAIDLAMAWLEKFPLSPEAEFVLHDLLPRTGLGKHAPRAIDLAMAWLEKFPLSPEAGFVLPRLLPRVDLGEHARRAIDLAMAWLEEFPLSPEAQFLLHALLPRTDLGEHAPRAIDLAMAWLEEFPLSQEAGFVLPPLLARTDLGEHAPRAIDLAMAWLEKFPLENDAEFVLKRLFGKRGLSPAQRTKCVAIALPQLKRLGSAPEASYLLRGCLRDRELDPESARLVLDYSVAWIRKNPQAEGADYIFNRVLRRPDLSEIVWKEASDVALAWLRSHASKENRDLALAALLARPDLLKERDLDWAVQEAEQWVTYQPKGAHSPTKLLAALERLHRRLDPNIAPDKLSTDFGKLVLAVRRQSEVPGPRELEQIIDSMTAALDTSRPALASFPLPSLLALIQPATHPELWAKLMALARRILAHPKFLPHHREGLTRAIWLLVDSGEWAEECARPVLEEIDLLRPRTSVRAAEAGHPPLSHLDE